MSIENDVTGWSWALNFARWVRDQSASFFASFWLYIILWTVVLGAFSVLLYIDGIFSRSLAPESINPFSFQAMGWCYRLFAVSFLMAHARCRIKGIDGGRTFVVLGVFSSAVVCLHAFGFGFEALSDRRDQAMAVREVVEIAQESNVDQIAALEARKTQIDTDLDKAVESLNAEIFQYITDGRNNDDLADSSRARRDRLQDEALTQKQAIDDQIIALVATGAEARSEAVQTTSDVRPWHPLFVGLAQFTTWSRDPTDWAIYLNAVIFVIFWVLLAESLVIFLPERIYVMHMHDAEAARQINEARSEAAKKGWETRKARNRGPRKVAQAGTRSDPHRADYWKDAVRKMIAFRRDNMPKAALSFLVEKFGAGRTEPEFGSGLRDAVRRGYVEQADYDRLMQTPAVANGAGPDFPPSTGIDDADHNAGDQPDQRV